MELIGVIQKLYSAASNVDTLHSFLTNDLANVLVTLGELQYSAAIAALKDAKGSTQPSREIAMAVTCLRLAYESFYSAASDNSLKTKLRVFFGEETFMGMFPSHRVPSSKGACESALMIAVSYRYLGEANLMNSFIQKAKQSFSIYAKYSSHLAYYSRYFRGKRYSPSSAMVAQRDAEIAIQEERQELDKLYERLQLT